MAKQIFVNLPVKDLQKSIQFFTQLGYSFNKEFTDDKAGCMVISEAIYVMLLVEPFFKTFTNNGICDTSRHTECINCLSADSREDVDAVVAKAVALGATTPKAPQDHGIMYGHGFTDLDGHHWEYMFMEPDAAN
ncbi:VOC family protein [Chitinophaga qingshengii]|uniref:Glyoxalase/bleomycin resistance/extradiol dioxygenase family protein n=1 Tax=Chitinophaga qingshengii TaxID=1569794 RepID=A0ABR7TUE5_9BACT|nr:VOC family protein [Chitinophaga qingshengii]MBC9933238.1 glyoxalase/bleomycin resistance/extradiol dioxygenase family protein [Chitinophaga qingshengii]